MEKLLLTEISGLKFNELCQDHGFILLKFVDYDSTKKKYYRNNLEFNINDKTFDHNTFNPTKECMAGGIYFFDYRKINIFEFNGYGDYVGFVHIPNDARVYIENDKFKSNVIVLTQPVHISVFGISSDPQICREMLELNIYPRHIPPSSKITRGVFRYISENMITTELCVLAVTEYGSHIRYVPEHLITFDMCKIAIEFDVTLFDRIPEHMRTMELHMFAVKIKEHKQRPLKKFRTAFLSE